MVPEQCEKERWYAWVPVLGERLLRPSVKLCQWEDVKQYFDLNKSRHILAQCLRALRTVNRFRGEFRNKAELSKYSYFVKIDEGDEAFDDTQKLDTIQLIILKEGDNGFPYPKWAAFFQGEKDKEKYLLNSLGVIEKFDQNGLYSFEIVGGIKPYQSLEAEIEELCASCIHTIVRDYYHQHVHHRSDAGIQPVFASSEKTAVEKMWEEHYARDIGIHRKRAISAGMPAAGEQKFSKGALFRFTGIEFGLRSTIGWHTANVYYTILAVLIDNSIGECNYGESFCSKFLVSTAQKSAYEAISRFKSTFTNFRSTLSVHISMWSYFSIRIAKIALGASIVIGLCCAIPAWIHVCKPPAICHVHIVSSQPSHLDEQTRQQGRETRLLPEPQPNLRCPEMPKKQSPSSQPASTQKASSVQTSNTPQ